MTWDINYQSTPLDHTEVEESQSSFLRSHCTNVPWSRLSSSWMFCEGNCRDEIRSILVWSPAREPLGWSLFSMPRQTAENGIRRIDIVGNRSESSLQWLLWREEEEINWNWVLIFGSAKPLARWTRERTVMDTGTTSTFYFWSKRVLAVWWWLMVSLIRYS